MTERSAKKPAMASVQTVNGGSSSRKFGWIPAGGPRAAWVKQMTRDKLMDHKNYVHGHAGDVPGVKYRKCQTK